MADLIRTTQIRQKWDKGKRTKQPRFDGRIGRWLAVSCGCSLAGSGELFGRRRTPPRHFRFMGNSRSPRHR